MASTLTLVNAHQDFLEAGVKQVFLSLTAAVIHWSTFNCHLLMYQVIKYTAVIIYCLIGKLMMLTSLKRDFFREIKLELFHCFKKMLLIGFQGPFGLLAANCERFSRQALRSCGQKAGGQLILSQCKAGFTFAVGVWQGDLCTGGISTSLYTMLHANTDNKRDCVVFWLFEQC